MKTNHSKIAHKKTLIETLGCTSYDVYDNFCVDYSPVSHDIERMARFFRDGIERILFRDIPVIMHQMYKFDQVGYKKISGNTEYDKNFKPACFRSLKRYVKLINNCSEPLVFVKLFNDKATKSINMKIFTNMLTENEYNIVLFRLTQFLNLNILTKNNYSFLKTEPSLIIVKLKID